MQPFISHVACSQVALGYQNLKLGPVGPTGTTCRGWKQIKLKTAFSLCASTIVEFWETMRNYFPLLVSADMECWKTILDQYCPCVLLNNGILEDIGQSTLPLFASAVITCWRTILGQRWLCPPLLEDNASLVLSLSSCIFLFAGHTCRDIWAFCIWNHSIAAILCTSMCIFVTRSVLRDFACILRAQSFLLYVFQCKSYSG